MLEYPSGVQYLSDRDSHAPYAALFDGLTTYASYALSPVDASSAADAHSVKDSPTLIQHVLQPSEEVRMPEHTCQKSTFSDGPQGNCPYIATAGR